MKMFKIVMLSLIVMLCAGIVIADEGDDADYGFIDCVRDQGTDSDASRLDLARAAIACKDYIDTEDIKLKFEEIKAKIEEAEIQEKMALFQACMEENGVTGLADLREIEEPRAVLGECILAAGIDVDELKEQAKDKISEALEEETEVLKEKAEEIKTCISEIDMEAMERTEAIEAVRACFSVSE